MIDKINKIIDKFEIAVITLGMAAGTLLLFTNVVLRYMFESGITWALEAVQYIFAWVVLIGAAHGVKAGIHLGIDILVEKFSTGDFDILHDRFPSGYFIPPYNVRCYQ